MRCNLRLVTPPTERAVTINEARRHLRVEDMDSDDLIVAYIEAAEQSLAYVGRALKPASYALDIYGQPNWEIMLPMPPFRTVSAVKTIGTGGTLTAIDPSAYTVTKSSEGRGFVFMPTGYTLPSGAASGVSASIEFTAGYDVVPAALRSAILLIAGSLYDNRASVAPINITKVPNAVECLVSPFQEQFL